MSDRTSSSSSSWTGTVRLREIRAAADLPVLFELQLDPEANRIAVVTPRDRAGFDAHWAGILGDGGRGGIFARAVLFDEALAGQISCFPMDGVDCVGYWIGREYWGRGVATRALRLLLEEVLVRPLHARAARSNVASIRVLERCGFVVTGYQVTPGNERFGACVEAVLVLAPPPPIPAAP